MRKIKLALQHAVAEGSGADEAASRAGADLTCKICFDRQYAASIALAWPHLELTSALIRRPFRCNVALSPCGHCVCSECLKLLPQPKTCPTCRERVARTVKLYLS